MGSDSETLLPLLLEIQFGSEWRSRWQRVDDPELRWLAIYVANEVGKGREAGDDRAALDLIAEGRGRLPAASRTNRATGAILAGLRAAALWPVGGASVRGMVM